MRGAERDDEERLGHLSDREDARWQKQQEGNQVGASTPSADAARVPAPELESVMARDYPSGDVSNLCLRLMEAAMWNDEFSDLCEQAHDALKCQQQTITDLMLVIDGKEVDLRRMAEKAWDDIDELSDLRELLKVIRQLHSVQQMHEAIFHNFPTAESVEKESALREFADRKAQ